MESVLAGECAAESQNLLPQIFHGADDNLLCFSRWKISASHLWFRIRLLQLEHGHYYSHSFNRYLMISNDIKRVFAGEGLNKSTKNSRGHAVRYLLP